MARGKLVSQDMARTRSENILFPASPLSPLDALLVHILDPAVLLQN